MKLRLIKERFSADTNGNAHNELYLLQIQGNKFIELENTS
jgi:hypothetical protein